MIDVSQELSAMGPSTTLQRVVAYDIAASYDLKALHRRFAGCSVYNVDPLFITWSGYRAMFLKYGVMVTFDNMPESMAATLIKEVTPFSQKSIKAALPVDTLDIAVGTEPRVEGTETMAVHEMDKATCLVIGIILGRSLALEHYEKTVDATLENFYEIIREISISGKEKVSKRELTKQIGSGLLIEHELAYNISIFDEPDVLWDGATEAASLYEALRGEFSLAERIRILQHKLSIIQNFSEFLISRMEGRRSHFLEGIIIALFVIDLIIVIFH